MRSKAWRRHQYRRTKARVIAMMMTGGHEWEHWKTPKEIGKRVATRRFCCHSQGCTEEARLEKIRDKRGRRIQSKRVIASWLQELDEVPFLGADTEPPHL